MATTDEKSKAGETATAAKGHATQGVVCPPEDTSGEIAELRPYWDRVISQKRRTTEQALLDIHYPGRQIDAIAEAALDAVAKNFATDRVALIALITRRGWATEIDAVTRRLNRQRLGEVRQRVLAVSYPWILARLLQSGEAAEPVRVKTREVADTLGFANAVVFELDRDDGPVHAFVGAIAEEVIRRRRLNIPLESVTAQLLTHKLRARI